jgi:magnesium-transporting ATPase (P-type)
MPFWSNPYIIGSTILSFILTLMTVQWDVLRNMFHFTKISSSDWALIILISISVIGVSELEKLISNIQLPARLIPLVKNLYSRG